ncbi:MAG: hypothetical protein SFV51_07865 [Bryobacteraceae bacterium]|nr:hypothetical protein [Bryobacteraceae bacterium]
MRTAICLLLSACAYGAPLYTVTDLGSLGAGAMLSLNNGGQSFGYSQTAAGRQAFSSAGPLQSAGSESIANQGNNFGQVTGVTWKDGRAQATMWANGLVSLLGVTGATESFGQAINDYGHLAGAAINSSGQLAAFVMGEGGLRWIGTLPGGDWSSAYGLNARGQVAGTSTVAGNAFHAFLWSAEDGMRDLGTLGGASSYAAAINRDGVVTGHSITASGATHGFVSSESGLRDIGTLDGVSSHAFGINSSGQVVGGSGGRAFVYHNAEMADLNRLIAPEAGWILVEAHAINDTGQIAGLGYHSGELRAFRLDPAAPLQLELLAAAPPTATPEPGTFGVVAAVVLAASLGLRGRR